MMIKCGYCVGGKKWTEKQLKKLSEIFRKFAKSKSEKEKLSSCFQALSDDDFDAVYQRACKIAQNIIKGENRFMVRFCKFLTFDDREFLTCFFIKGISSEISEETNKAILSFLGNLLKNNGLRRKYSQEIVKRAIGTGYSFYGEDGERFSCLKSF